MKKNSDLRERSGSWLRTGMIVSLFASVTLLFAACDKEDDDGNPPSNTIYALSGNASGSLEVPAVTTGATAVLTGQYILDSNLLHYTIDWTGLSGDATVAHFHGPALAGESAGPIHDLAIVTNGVNGSASGTLLLADSTESHLLSGKLYYNIHTVANPNGEIRGQVAATVQ